MENASETLCDGLHQTLDFTNVSDAVSRLYSTSEQIVITIILPCMLIICVVGNFAFLFSVKRVKRLHTIVNFYLVTLAVADVSYVVNGTAGYAMLYITTPVRSDWPNGYECWIVTSLGRLSYYTSIGIMTIVTLDRYMAICYPFKHRAINSMTRAVKLVIITLIVAIIFSVISVILAYGKLNKFCVLWPETDDYDSFPTYVNFCSPMTPNGRVYYELLILIPFVAALIANGYMYFRIVNGLNHRHDAVKIADTQVQTQAIEGRNQITRMLIISGVLFFLCQVLRRVASLHFILIVLADYYIFTESQYGIVVLVGRALLYLNSAINPLIYTIASSHYRKSFAEAFCCYQTQYKKSELGLNSSSK